jgi:hypothetical protein
LNLELMLRISNDGIEEDLIFVIDSQHF